MVKRYLEKEIQKHGEYNFMNLFHLSPLLDSHDDSGKLAHYDIFHVLLVDVIQVGWSLQANLLHKCAATMIRCHLVILYQTGFSDLISSVLALGSLEQRWVTLGHIREMNDAK